MRIAMLVSNRDVLHDNRVRKEAASLSSLGYEVHVLAHTRSALPEGEAQYHAIRWEYGPDPGGARAAVSAHAAAFREARGLRQAAALAAARARLRAVGAYRGVLRRRSVESVARKAVYARRARPLLEQLRPDVVHAHDLKTLAAARLYADRRGVPYVYDAHELEVHSLAVGSPIERGIAWSVERYGIRKAAAIITVSDAIAAEIARIHGVSKPAVVLNAPSARTATAAPAFSLRERCALPPGSQLVVYVGAVHPARGTSELVRALARTPPSYHLAILGGRVARADAELEAVAAAAGVAERLHLLEPVPGEQLPATMREADAAVIPGVDASRSYRLAMPNKLFEAAMAAIPVVVSSARPEQVRFVQEHELGVAFESGNEAALAAALQHVVAETPPGIADRGRLAELQARFSWEAQERVLADVYASVLQRSRR